MRNSSPQLNITNIINDIKLKGYSTVSQVLPKESCNRMIATLHQSMAINQNYITGGFSTSKTGFLSNAMARDHTTFDFLTSDFIINLSNQYLGDARLKAHRLYFTRGRCSNFPWHTDNKVSSTVDRSRGLVGIVYLNNVKRGGISVIENGYIESTHSIPTSVQINKLIQSHGIFSFSGNAGDAIFFDQSLVHQAARDFFVFETINALFFQIVDCKGKVEPLLLGSSQIPEADSPSYKFLSIGLPNQLDFAQPQTIEQTYPLDLLLRLIPSSFFSYFMQLIRTYLRFLRRLFRSIGRH